MAGFYDHFQARPPFLFKGLQDPGWQAVNWSGRIKADNKNVLQKNRFSV